MNREDKMMAHFESVTNIRYTNTDKALMTAAMRWADSHPVNQWCKAEDELPPRKSEDSHLSLVVIVSDGFDFEKAYYDYFYGTWVGNNITPMYWMRLLKPEE